MRGQRQSKGEDPVLPCPTLERKPKERLVSSKNRDVRIPQVNYCKPNLGLDVFDDALLHYHLKRKLVKDPDSRHADPGLAEGHRLFWARWSKGCKTPHLGWRDRLDCILHQQDSNLLAQDCETQDFSPGPPPGEGAALLLPPEKEQILTSPGCPCQVCFIVFYEDYIST